MTNNTDRARQRLPRPYRSATRVRPIDRHTRRRGPRLLSQRQAVRHRRAHHAVPWGRLLLSVAVLVAALAAWEVRTAHSYTLGEYWTRYYAAAYGLSGDGLWNVALCESGGSPYAVGPASSEGAPYGLFQTKAQTFYWLRQQLNLDPELAPHLATYDPEFRDMDADGGAAEAHLAAWAVAHRLGGLWVCVSSYY